MSDSPDAVSPTTYSILSRHWPRIAAGLVAIAAFVDWLIGGLTSDGALEFYVFAWATITGGLWFLFENAEKSLSDEVRTKVVSWLRDTDFRASLRSIPAQFALLFDRVFGEKHVTRRCFNRSCVASLVSYVAVFLLLSRSLPDQFMLEGHDQGPALLIGAFFGVVPFNFLPDYLSLLQTRWAIGWMERTGRVWSILLLDLVATTLISAGGMLLIAAFFLGLGDLFLLVIGGTPEADWAGFMRSSWDAARGIGPNAGMGLPIQVALVSAFFTSVWLWVYAAALPVSRGLLRLNAGAGVLLRVTDVENQPFRSLGFVAVLVLSGLFLLGLPLVLF